MKHKILVLIEDVKAGMVTAGPVFALNDDGAQVMLVKDATPLTDAIISSLNRYRVKSVTILSDSLNVIGEVEGHRPKAPNVILPDLPKIEPVISDELTTEALDGIQGLFAVAAGSNVTTAYRAVKQLDDVVDQLVQTVADETGGLVHISHLKSYDDYTFHHSLSVAVLAIAIGRAMNMDRQTLTDLGRTAIKHDIGKILMPIEILNKTGKLTDEEFEIMKGHSAKGAEYLEKEGIGNRTMWQAIRAHHEKLDGTGYPDGLKGAEIPLFARIISVADVYDAITSYRPYRGPMSPSAAFELVTGDVGRAFEYDIVNAFAKTVEFYPKGTIVLLSNGRIGVVTSNRNALRPKLQMLDNGEVVDMTEMANLHLMIKKVENYAN